MPVVDTDIGSPLELRDGTRVHIRAIRSDDAPRLQALYSALSPSSAFFRFLTYWKELPRAQAEYLAHVDYSSRMALVATLGTGLSEQIVGIASYVQLLPLAEGVAEAAIVVEDDYQGLGLGSELLSRLASFARERGINAFAGTVHYQNTHVLDWLEQMGLCTEIICPAENVADMQVRVELPTRS